MPKFDYDGFKIAYEDRGRPLDPPIVLVHGLLLPRKHHYPLADALVQRRNRVILIDLLGHGESDHPDKARHFTMELFGSQVVALLDHLDIHETVILGTSLGANVALEVVVHSPPRVRGMVIEMPVLERAAPAAGVMFLPLTIAYAELSSAFDWWNRFMARLPAFPGTYGEVLKEVISRDPIPSAAILHGLLTGRMAPHASDREKVENPALIIGHQRDLLHPFSDAEALHRELRNSELVQASSFFELRFPPNRLSDRICNWLDEIWV